MSSFEIENSYSGLQEEQTTTIKVITLICLAFIIFCINFFSVFFVFRMVSIGCITHLAFWESVPIIILILIVAYEQLQGFWVKRTILAILLSCLIVSLMNLILTKALFSDISCNFTLLGLGFLNGFLGGFLGYHFLKRNLYF